MAAAWLGVIAVACMKETAAPAAGGLPALGQHRGGGRRPGQGRNQGEDPHRLTPTTPPPARTPDHSAGSARAWRIPLPAGGPIGVSVCIEPSPLPEASAVEEARAPARADMTGPRSDARPQRPPPARRTRRGRSTIRARASAGIGRRDGFRCRCLRTWGFESPSRTAGAPVAGRTERSCRRTPHLLFSVAKAFGIRSARHRERRGHRSHADRRTVRDAGTSAGKSGSRIDHRAASDGRLDLFAGAGACASSGSCTPARSASARSGRTATTPSSSVLCANICWQLIERGPGPPAPRQQLRADPARHKRHEALRRLADWSDRWAATLDNVPHPNTEKGRGALGPRPLGLPARRARGSTRTTTRRPPALRVRSTPLPARRKGRANRHKGEGRGRCGLSRGRAIPDGGNESAEGLTTVADRVLLRG